MLFMICIVKSLEVVQYLYSVVKIIFNEIYMLTSIYFQLDTQMKPCYLGHPNKGDCKIIFVIKIDLHL